MASNTPKRGFGRWLVLDDIVNIWADLKFKQKVKVGAIESGKKKQTEFHICLFVLCFLGCKPCFECLEKV